MAHILSKEVWPPKLEEWVGMPPPSQPQFYFCKPGLGYLEAHREGLDYREAHREGLGYQDARREGLGYPEAHRERLGYPEAHRSDSSELKNQWA
jgi:hypothetical protein